MPGLLHIAHVVGGRFDVIGAGVAGIPLVAMGHNRDLAWGITAALADVSDCYLETVDPDDPTRYLTPDGWMTGRTRIERIKVRGAETVEERVLETRHGPIIGPVLAGESRAIALRSTSLEPGDPLAPVLDLCAATTVEEFDAAVGRRPGVPFNYVYASRDGHIGYRMSGSIPEREHGEGLLPQDGMRSPGRPHPRPTEEMPHLLDPPEGIVANANNDPGGPFELGDGWCEPWRVERIVELLRSRPTHSIETFETMQVDTYSGVMARLRDHLLAADAVPGIEERSILEAWDGRLEAGSAGATIVSTTYMELARNLATRVAGAEAPILLGGGWGSIGSGSFSYRLQGHILRLLAVPEPPWLDDFEDRDRTLRVAAARALETLRGKLGPSPWGWRWGDLHTWRLPHPMEAVPALGRRFSRGPYPFSGDGNTVLQSGYSVHRGPESGILPGYRQVVDLADFDRSVYQLSTGNSGIPGHPRYGDCIEEFLAGQNRPLLFTRIAVERNIEHRLRLEPV
jgi:penicillin amidase